MRHLNLINWCHLTENLIHFFSLSGNSESWKGISFQKMECPDGPSTTIQQSVKLTVPRDKSGAAPNIIKVLSFSRISPESCIQKCLRYWHWGNTGHSRHRKLKLHMRILMRWTHSSTTQTGCFYDQGYRLKRKEMLSSKIGPNVSLWKSSKFAVVVLVVAVALKWQDIRKQQEGGCKASGE